MSEGNRWMVYVFIAFFFVMVAAAVVDTALIVYKENHSVNEDLQEIKATLKRIERKLDKGE